MQELTIKCDVCLTPMKERNEKINLRGALSSGLRQHGMNPIIINYKDICPDCSFGLYKALDDFQESRRFNKTTTIIEVT